MAIFFFSLKRRRYFPSSLWEAVEIEELQELPWDVDGHRLIKVEYDKDPLKWMLSTRDGRPWKEWSRSRECGNFIQKRVARCSGSYTCKNTGCFFLAKHGKANKTQSEYNDEKRVCFSCGTEMAHEECECAKIWEFHDLYMLVKHWGTHTCYVKPRPQLYKQETKEAF